MTSRILLLFLILIRVSAWEIAKAQSPVISGVVSDAQCYGSSDGEISYTISGNTPPVTYSWSNGVNGIIYGNCWTLIKINNPGIALTDYQVMVNMPYYSGTTMNSDFSNIRFTDSIGTVNYSYWLESKTNSSTASFWVKVPSIPSGISYFRVSYCNTSDTSLSNGQATFDYFDDFEDLDFSDWTHICQNASEAGELCEIGMDTTWANMPNSLKLSGKSECGNPSSPKLKSRAEKSITLTSGTYKLDVTIKIQSCLHTNCSDSSSTNASITNGPITKSYVVQHQGSCACTNSIPFQTRSNSFTFSGSPLTFGLETEISDCGEGYGLFDNFRIKKSASGEPVITVNPPQTLLLTGLAANTYSVTVTDGALNTTNEDFIVEQPSADTGTFGNNEWIVYCYNGINFEIYRGYYKETDLSFDSRTRWSVSGTPSDALGYDGCIVNNEIHSVKYKRTGFTSGYYSISIPGHDNFCNLLINSISVFSHDWSGLDNHNNVWTGYLDNASTVEFNWRDQNDKSYGIVNFTMLPGNPADLIAGTINNDTTICYSGDPGASTDGITIKPVHDAYVRSGAYSDTSYSAIDTINLWAKSNNDPDFARYIYVTFEISSLPSTINSAIFNLYGYITSVNNNYNIPVDIYSIADTTWDESTITFNTRPATGALIASAIMYDNTYQNYYWDITSYVAAEKAGGKTRISLLVKQNTWNLDLCVFNSKEATGTNYPKLLVNQASSSCTISYQWESSPGCTGVYTAVPGATLATYDVPPGLTQTTCYRRKVIDSCGNTAYSNTVTITVNDPPAPVTNDSSVCGSGTVVLTANGSPFNYKWYNAPAGGISFATDDNYTTPSINDTTSYYVASTDSLGCESAARTLVTAYVYPLPVAPTAVGASRCGPGTIDLTATGSVNYKWYDALAGGTLLGTGTSYTTASLDSTTDFYVSAVSADGCESINREIVTVTIDTIPPMPVALDTNRCGTGVLSLKASGSSGIYKWYSVPTGGVSIGEGSPWTTPYVSSDTIFHVSAINGSCESNRSALSINIFPESIPGILSSDNLQVCEEANAGIISLNGYDGDILGWLSSTDDFNSSTNMLSSVNDQYSFTDLQTSTYYKTIVKKGACPADTTKSLYIKVDEATNAGILSVKDLRENDGIISLEGYTRSIVRWEVSVDSFQTFTTINHTDPDYIYSYQSGVYYRTVVKSGVCPEKYSDILRADGFKVYYGFSPNDDGYNDVWIIDGINYFPDNTVTIFNRWGDEVFKMKGYNNEDKVWDGTTSSDFSLNKQLPPDTYFYTIETGRMKLMAGYVVLNR